MTQDYFDLGTYSRPITTSSKKAQMWFDRGLMWLYGYNHAEAVVCFERALEYDDSCVMAYWGIAYGVGCNYNKEWRVFSEGGIVKAIKKARTALNQGKQFLDRVTPAEAALLTALEMRFQADGLHEEEVLVSWNTEYAAAMREVYQQFREDWDVVTLFAEALINRTPWQLWDLPTNQPAEGADTVEAMTVIETAIAKMEADGGDPHPGLLHIYIHIMEMSPTPEKALRASDILRNLAPDAGHLKHMPSHIDILCGDYYNAVAANDRGIEADDKFLAVEGDLNEYTSYRGHNMRFKMYAAMFLGQYKTSLDAAVRLAELAHEDILRLEVPPMAQYLESMVSMKLHVLIRFGKWEDILEEPFPEDTELYCVTLAMLHYARAIALATLGRHDDADEERRLFKVAQEALHEPRWIFNNTCEDVLKIAEAMMHGEVEYHQGNYDVAFDHLRRAVYLDDNLKYAEPWSWMMPTRHALGALLLAQGHVEEATAVYRADLGLDDTIYRPMQHPNNVWALRGYVSCLEQQGKTAEAEAWRGPLNLALARADVDISVSCYCAATTKSCCQ